MTAAVFIRDRRRWASSKSHVKHRPRCRPGGTNWNAIAAKGPDRSQLNGLEKLETCPGTPAGPVLRNPLIRAHDKPETDITKPAAGIGSRRPVVPHHLHMPYIIYGLNAD